MSSGGLCLGNGSRADLIPATREEGAIMTPKEIINHIISLLEHANIRQLELIDRIVQAVLK